MTWEVRLGDCRTVLAALAAESVDAIVTDPPYELGFMGKRWDASGIAYDVGMWREALRVLKPGGHLLSFGGTRTYHRMACAIEDAGFEVRDSLHWLYGSGFPKSLDVSKAIDAAAGAERESVGPATRHGGGASEIMVGDYNPDRTAPATPDAERWSGWGTALKPAHEPIVMARKPLGSTVAECVLRHGTGGLNVEACRVKGAPPSVPQPDFRRVNGVRTGLDAHARNGEMSAAAGRWPPNLLLTHDPRCNGVCAPGCPVAEMDRQSGDLASGSRAAGEYGRLGFGGWDAGPMPPAEGDSGGASRFFPVFRYVAKPARGERDAGCWDLEPASGGDATDREDGSDGLKSPRAGAGRNGGARNIHPTVKPVALMEWLVRLVTPPGGLVLDPFLGSGTTGCAAVRQGFRFLGIEREAEYVAIAERRIALALNAPRSKAMGELDRGDDALPGQLSLLGSGSR